MCIYAFIYTIYIPYIYSLGKIQIYGIYTHKHTYTQTHTHIYICNYSYCFDYAMIVS